MVRVKICGITNRGDAGAAVEAGADALGFIFAPSTRKVSPQAAREIIRSLPPFVIKVGVFVNERISIIREIVEWCGINVIQFHGSESPEVVRRFYPASIKAFKMKAPESVEAISAYRMGAALLDTYYPSLEGGTGKAFNWSWALAAKKAGVPVILSGGLNPDNVRDAIQMVHPYAVDVASGVESSPGKKDRNKVQDFITRAKSV